MLEAQLRNIHALVGEITTHFNYVETLWYLIFTCLLHPAPRHVIDAVFQQHKTGVGQRQLIKRVASAIRHELSGAETPNEEVIRLYEKLNDLCKATEDISKKRNDAIHSAFYITDAAIPPRIHVSNIFSPSPLSGRDIQLELTNLLAEIEYHSIDVDELRINLANLISPNLFAEHDARRLARLRQIVAEKYPMWNNGNERTA